MNDSDIVLQRINRVQREDASNDIVITSRVAITTDGLVSLPMRVGGFVLVAYHSGQAVYEVV